MTRFRFERELPRLVGRLAVPAVPANVGPYAIAAAGYESRIATCR